MAAENNKILLKSNDDEVFEVDRSVIHLSRTLTEMFQNPGVNHTMLADPIKLPNVNGRILRKVIAWCQHHQDDPPVADRTNVEIPSWDAEFFKEDQDNIFELIMAANYLDVSGLLDVSCKYVANMIIGKSPEEIRRIFDIRNDFTPEQEEQIRRENACFEE